MKRYFKPPTLSSAFGEHWYIYYPLMHTSSAALCMEEQDNFNNCPDPGINRFRSILHRTQTQRQPLQNPARRPLQHNSLLQLWCSPAAWPPSTDDVDVCAFHMWCGRVVRRWINSHYNGLRAGCGGRRRSARLGGEPVWRVAFAWPHIYWRFGLLHSLATARPHILFNMDHRCMKFACNPYPCWWATLVNITLSTIWLN